MSTDGLLAVAWRDIGKTKSMSNFHLPRVATVQRWERGCRERSTRPAPVMMVEYNQLMGGTDLFDQRRGNYSCQRRSKKWWHALFYFTLDTMMVSPTTPLPFHNTPSLTHSHTHSLTHTGAGATSPPAAKTCDHLTTHLPTHSSLSLSPPPRPATTYPPTYPPTPLSLSLSLTHTHSCTHPHHNNT